ncbi:hypothetical protein ACHAPU_009135 [Fusarium lateritium]
MEHLLTSEATNPELPSTTPPIPGEYRGYPASVQRNFIRIFDCFGEWPWDLLDDDTPTYWHKNLTERFTQVVTVAHNQEISKAELISLLMENHEFEMAEKLNHAVCDGALRALKRMDQKRKRRGQDISSESPSPLSTRKKQRRGTDLQEDDPSQVHCSNVDSISERESGKDQQSDEKGDDGHRHEWNSETKQQHNKLIKAIQTGVRNSMSTKASPPATGSQYLDKMKQDRENLNDKISSLSNNVTFKQYQHAVNQHNAADIELANSKKVLEHLEAAASIRGNKLPTSFGEVIRIAKTNVASATEDKRRYEDTYSKMCSYLHAENSEREALSGQLRVVETEIGKIEEDVAYQIQQAQVAEFRRKLDLINAREPEDLLDQVVAWNGVTDSA